MLATRILTALVGIPLFIAVLVVPGGGLFAFAGSVLAGIGISELVRAYRHHDSQRVVPNFLLLAWGSSLPFLVWRFPEMRLEYTLLPVLGAAFLWELGKAWRWGRAPALSNIGYGLFCAFYVGWLMSFLVRLRADGGQVTFGSWQTEQGILWVLWLMAMLWSGDSVAYFVGKLIGRRKIAPSISPAKTVEGSVANLVLCAAVGYWFGGWLGVPSWVSLTAGLGVGIMGQLGDLFESLLKRSLGIKDFGGILPGHGGVLDRFDSLLFSAPWMWGVLTLAGYLR